MAQSCCDFWFPLGLLVTYGWDSKAFYWAAEPGRGQCYSMGHCTGHLHKLVKHSWSSEMSGPQGNVWSTVSLSLPLTLRKLGPREGKGLAREITTGWWQRVGSQASPLPRAVVLAAWLGRSCPWPLCPRRLCPGGAGSQRCLSSRGITDEAERLLTARHRIVPGWPRDGLGK